MRRSIVITAIGLLVVAAVLGGAYLLRKAPPEIADLSLSGSNEAVATTGSAFTFPLLDEPRELPDLTFLDGQGHETSLAAFDDQIVLLNIWATWCVPCREEMPSLDRLQARLGGPDFQVVALSIDNGGLPIVSAFYQELGLEALDIYVDSTGAAARDLGVFGIPTTLLIGQSGRELGRLAGAAQWDSDAAVELIGTMIVLATGGECDCPMGQMGRAGPDP